MPVTELDALTNNGDSAPPATFAVSAGSNRRAFVAVANGSGFDASPATAATLGGQSMDVVATADDPASTWDVAVTLFALNESQIAAMSGSDLSITGVAEDDRSVVWLWSVEGARQDSIGTVATDTVSAASGSVSLSRAGDSRTYAFSAHDAAGTVTTANPSTVTGSNTNYTMVGGGQADTENVSDFTFSVSPETSRQWATVLVNIEPADTTPEIRKSSTFDIETTLSGTVTSATLNGNAITVDSQTGTTVTLTDSDGSITTSGEYDLVLTDDSADPDETIVVQVNVVGVAPSSNPLQKDGAALASLSNVQIRIANGANLNGVQRYYTAIGTTDASGNLGNIDLSDTAADVDDSVLLQILTAAGDSITAPEIVELI